MPIRYRNSTNRNSTNRYRYSINNMLDNLDGIQWKLVLILDPTKNLKNKENYGSFGPFPNDYLLDVYTKYQYLETFRKNGIYTDLFRKYEQEYKDALNEIFQSGYGDESGEMVRIYRPETYTIQWDSIKVIPYSEEGYPLLSHNTAFRLNDLFRDGQYFNLDYLNYSKTRVYDYTRGGKKIKTTRKGRKSKKSKTRKH